MELFAGQFQIFTVLLARLLSVFSVAPFFGGQGISYFYRMSLAFIIAALVTPVTEMPPEFYNLMQNRYITLLIEQAFIGFLIGFSLVFLFAAFQMAGEFFSVQMGFGISEVFDPISQISMPLMGTIKNLLALFVFFVSGSHIYLIQAIVFSYEAMPYLSSGFLTEGVKHEGILEFLVLLSSGMFLISLKIALPVMGTLLLVSITLGLLSKAAPQMNILMLGFPMKILISFLVLAFIAPLIIHTMFEQFDIYFNHLDNVIKSWGSQEP